MECGNLIDICTKNRILIKHARETVKGGDSKYVNNDRVELSLGLI